MRIIDPTCGTRAEEHRAEVTLRRAAPEELCLFSNSKPGVAELFDGIARRLVGEHGLAGIGRMSKPAASVPAAGETLDRLAERYRSVVLAVGD